VAEHQNEYLIVASMGGAPTHPSRYLNLTADPRVSVQVRAESFEATARTAGAGEKARFWKVMTEVWPNYDAYQSRTDRVIPVVVLTSAKPV
jgi:deazaflavin-dependent oxidoreductase (nitroreductase family)